MAARNVHRTARAMADPSFVLSNFVATRPRYVLSQTRSLEWLAQAHAQAEASLAGLDDGAREVFAARIARALARCACAPDKIRQRGVSIDDAHRSDWDNNVLYELRRHPHGKGTAARMRLFASIVDGYFESAYAADAVPPDELLHVTCTGYVSPSGAQKLVARRGWGAITRATHAYHMGCYAAIPAVRLAAGALAQAPLMRRRIEDRRVDVVHTELCSLHLDPADHRLEQLVVQSLFADGLIRYSVEAESAPRASGLRLLATHEQILPDSADAMTWVVSDHGMQMTLARDVPERIAHVLRGFVRDLYRAGSRDLGALRDSVFAVHPGGPKILDGVRDVLELTEPQIAASRRVLLDHGNMSSATLPHIWMRLVAGNATDAGDVGDAIPDGTLVPSLAFGPGLTIVGALFEKVGSSCG